MPFNDERHNFRDPGFPGYLHVQELTPAERKAALEAQEAGEQKAAEDYKKSVAARREMEEKAESMWDDVVRENCHQDSRSVAGRKSWLGSTAGRQLDSCLGAPAQSRTAGA